MQNKKAVSAYFTSIKQILPIPFAEQYTWNTN